MRKTRILAGAALLLVAAAVPIAAQADQISDRATLEAILGGNGTLEDFETLNIGFGGQRTDASGLLNSETMFDGDGPGLVQPGADYISPRLWWNGDGYLDLNTQTLADSSAWRDREITVEYTAAVTAMGFDMQGYAGFGMSGSVDVYDTGGDLLGSPAVNGGFFGWENDAGIGSVVISANASEYIMIDDHLYGVPEPSTAAALAVLGLCAASRRRRG